MAEHLYPILENDEGPPTDGQLFKAPSYCSRASRSVCRKHYEQVNGQPGLYTCPYGFSSVVIEYENELFTYTGLRIAGHYDRQKLKTRTRGEFLPSMSVDAFADSLSRSLPFGLQMRKFEKQIAEIETVSIKNEVKIKQIHVRQQAQSDFSSLILHDVRKLNAQLKSQAEELIWAADGKSFTKYRAENIFATSTLISVRLDAYDFETNPDIATAGGKKRIGVYRKFDKSRHCLQVTSSNKAGVDFSGNSRSLIDAYAVFDLLPYVLLENAIKYSPPSCNVSVDFSEHSEGIVVRTTSVGPRVEPSELEQLFERGFRGRNAIESKTPGTGIGLYLARRIADVHGFLIDVEPGDELMKVHGVPFGNFSVKLSISLPNAE